MAINAYDLKRADYQDFCNDFIGKHMAMTVNDADRSLKPHTITSYDPIRDAAFDVFEEIMEKISINELGALLKDRGIDLGPIEEAVERIAERAYDERYDH